MRFAYFVPLLVVGCYNPGDLGDTPYRCSATYPECPDGYVCQLNTNLPNVNRCVVDTSGSSAPLTLPKGGHYSGPHVDPGLNMNNCPDLADEQANGGNNDIAHAEAGFDAGGIETNLAICPAKDVDVYSINLQPSEFAMVKISYKINQGDLDIGLFKADGTLLVSDTDFTRDNACVITQSPGVQPLFLAVLGGSDSDMNRYDLTITKSTMKNSLSCGVSMPQDASITDGG